MTPPTLRAQILDAVVVLLEAAGADKPTHLEAVHRFRFRPIDREKLSAIVVYPFRNSPEESEVEARGDAFTFAIELRAKQLATGTGPDALIEDLYWWAVSQLLTDPTLGGLVNDLEEGETTWQGKDLTEAFAAAAVQFTATYHRRYDDPAVAG